MEDADIYAADKTFSFQDVQDTYASNSKKMDIVTAGCTYRGATSLTVHGKVTDFQMWGRALPDEELLKVYSPLGAAGLKIAPPTR